MLPEKQNGLIEMKNAASGPEKPWTKPWLVMLTEWLIILAETFTKSSLSPEQISGYEMGLEGYSEKELNMGFRRALRIWNYAGTLPPPNFIRECIAAMLEEEKAHENAEEMARHKLFEKRSEQKRLTLEEAWADWEEVQRLEAEVRARLGVLRTEQRVELKKTYEKDLVLATPERLRELKEQTQFLKVKYGEGKTVRVRDSVSSEANEGSSGTERDAEKRGSDSGNADPSHK